MSILYTVHFHFSYSNYSFNPWIKFSCIIPFIPWISETHVAPSEHTKHTLTKRGGCPAAAAEISSLYKQAKIKISILAVAYEAWQPLDCLNCCWPAYISVHVRHQSWLGPHTIQCLWMYCVHLFVVCLLVPTLTVLQYSSLHMYCIPASLLSMRIDKSIPTVQYMFTCVIKFCSHVK